MMLCPVTLIVISYVAFHLIENVIRSRKVGEVDKKIVFVTGCDSGFGKQLALRLDSLGFQVFAACLTSDGEKSLAHDASSRLTTLPLDVSDTTSIQAALDFVKEKLPDNTGLWAVVNNAGIAGPICPTELSSLEGFKRTLDVNLLGPIEICRKFLPLLRKEKGRVVNMVSVMGRSAFAMSAYNTSKFAMEGFSDSLRREVSRQGIQVCILEPGSFRTNMMCKASLLASVLKQLNEAAPEVHEIYRDHIQEEVLDISDDIEKLANPNTHLVVDAYMHAISSRYPKTRYVIGLDAQLVFVPLSYLPAGLADWIYLKLKQRLIQTSRGKRAKLEPGAK